MARRRSPTPRFFEKYPGLNQRTNDTWTTRYYHRKQDSIINMMGLNTSPDDFHKKEGSSPFLRNVRYMGEREVDQRAQVMSRKGAALIGTVGEDKIPKDISAGQAYLEIYEGKAIQYQVIHNKRLTGISLHLYNKESAEGFMKVTVRDPATSVELANGVVDLKKVSTTSYSHHEIRFIRSVIDTRVKVRIEILDDVDNSDMAVEKPRRSVRILSTVENTHEFATYDLPNANEVLQEIPYVFQSGGTAPLTGVLINDWETMPRSKDFVFNGQKHMIFPVKRDGVIELYKTNLLTKEITLVTNLVSNEAKVVRFAQAEGYLYYVDGISPLRRINLTTLAAEDAIPKVEEITVPDVNPASLTAKVGGSLIHFLQNHIYISGFKDDPNLVIVSLIDDIKPRFDQYNDRFYSPDQSPELSAGNPITAFADYSDYLIVWRQNDLTLYSAGSGYETGGTSSTTPEGTLGVLNQEAVAQGKNNIYFFNSVEGVCRFGGSVYRNVSSDIENTIKGIKNPEAVFMLYQNKRVHMFFSLNGDVPDMRLYYYTELEGNTTLPWYLDTNTPVSSAVADKRTNAIYAVHSEVAAVMDMDSQFTDFDSYIEMEYHTQYRLPTTATAEGWCYVRRIHVHEIANSTHSLYIGVDIDHQDRPYVWRYYVEATVNQDVNPDAIFPQAAEAGNVTVSIPAYIKCRRYQVRLKRYCYKDTAEVTGANIEYDNKDAI